MLGSQTPFRLRSPSNGKRLHVEILEEREMPSFGLDSSFGLAGLNLNSLGDMVQMSSLAGLVTLPDGHLLTVGNLAGSGASTGIGDIGVVRLNDIGAADPSFGAGNGLATVAIIVPHTVSAMLVQPDGKILLAGTRPASADPANIGNSLFVMRLNADASIDKTFGNAGEVTIAFGGDDLLSQLAIQADGKIVVAGSTRFTQSASLLPVSSELAVVRLNADGGWDTAFGSNGELLVSSTGNDWTTAGIAIQADGKIIVDGNLTPMTNAGGSTFTELTVYRFNADGTADTSFNGSGQTQTNYKAFNYASATSLALLTNGEIVVGGASYNGIGLLAWFNADGSLLSQEQLGSDLHGLQWVSKLQAMPQGGVEALGYSYDGSDLTIEYHAAPLSLANREELSFGSGYNPSGEMTVQADGKLVVASVSNEFPSIDSSSTTSRLTLARFSDPGSTDSSATFISGTGRTVLHRRLRHLAGTAARGAWPRRHHRRDNHIPGREHRSRHCGGKWRTA